MTLEQLATALHRFFSDQPRAQLHQLASNFTLAINDASIKQYRTVRLPPGFEFIAEILEEPLLAQAACLSPGRYAVQLGLGIPNPLKAILATVPDSYRLELGGADGLVV